MASTPAQQMLYPVGVEDLYIAFITGGKDTANTIPTYESEIYQIPAIEVINMVANQTTAEKWASNKLFVNVVKNASHALTIDYPALPIEVVDKIYGLVAQKGVTIETSDPKEYPYFAIGVVAPLSDGNKIGRWYPRVQATPAADNWTTQTNETTIPTQQLAMTATPLLYNKVTKVDFNSARTSATGVTIEDFMAQVICDESQLATLGSGGTDGSDE